MPYLHAVVQGRVQGVGFRWFVVDEARRLGLRGAVRNLPNGDVEVEAVGGRASLDKLVDRLNRGPSHAHVIDVQCEWSENEPAFSEFGIGY
jgi:acylphosphatase